MEPEQQEQQSDQKNSQTSSGSKSSLKILEAVVVVALIVFSGLYYFYYTENKKDELKNVDTVASSLYNHNFEEALKITSDVLENDPNNIAVMLAEASIWNQRGFIELKETEYSAKALELANTVLLLDKTNSEAWRIIGYSYEIRGEFSKAIEAYNKAIELNPDGAFAYNNLGHVYDLTGNLARAKANYLKANSLNPDIDMVHLNLGRVLYREDDFNGALYEFDIALELTEAIRIESEAYYSSGVIYIIKGEHDKAEELFNLGINADSTYSSNFVGLARNLFFETRLMTDIDSILLNINKALENLRIAKEVEPEKTMIYLTEGIIYNTLEQHGLAKESLDEALRVIDQDPTQNALDKEIIRSAIYAEFAKL